jgi:hypothetical protein
MAAGNTYTPIATTTTSSSAASVTFSSISSAYTDLIIIVNGGASGAVNLYMQVGNGSLDTSTNYSRTALSGTGSVGASSRNSSVAFYRVDNEGYLNTTFPAETAIINVMNYKNTNVNKTFISRTNNVVTGLDATVGLWRSTSAINIISVYPQSGTFTNGTTVSLYGIVAA